MVSRVSIAQLLGSQCFVRDGWPSAASEEEAAPMHVKVPISVFEFLRAHASTLIIFIPPASVHFILLRRVTAGRCRGRIPAKPQWALISLCPRHPHPSHKSQGKGFYPLLITLYTLERTS